jgi:CPA2 family monovalent cation:H+ antiporter-2
MQKEFIVVDFDIKVVEEAKLEDIPIILGNAAQKDVLRHLNIEKSKAAIIAIENQFNLRLIIEAILSINKNINIVAKADDEFIEDEMLEYNLKHIVNQARLVSEILVKEAIK